MIQMQTNLDVADNSTFVGRLPFASGRRVSSSDCPSTVVCIFSKGVSWHLVYFHARHYLLGMRESMG